MGWRSLHATSECARHNAERCGSERSSGAGESDVVYRPDLGHSDKVPLRAMRRDAAVRREGGKCKMLATEFVAR